MLLLAHIDCQRRYSPRHDSLHRPYKTQWIRNGSQNKVRLVSSRCRRDSQHIVRRSKCHADRHNQHLLHKVTPSHSGQYLHTPHHSRSPRQRGTSASRAGHSHHQCSLDHLRNYDATRNGLLCRYRVCKQLHLDNHCPEYTPVGTQRSDPIQARKIEPRQSLLSAHGSEHLSLTQSRRPRQSMSPIQRSGSMHMPSEQD